MAQGTIIRPSNPKPTTTAKKHSTIKISKPDGFIGNHGYVDLGLPSGLKWATCNIGASSPSDYGDYYAWSEVTTKLIYSKGNNDNYNKEIGDISGNPQYDAARANWGKTWRIPTMFEMEELLNKCRWIWTRQNRQNGYMVIGPNNKSIFLPAAGLFSGETKEGIGTFLGYCSSTPGAGSTTYAYYLWFELNKKDKQINDNGRWRGHSVRPVSD